MRQAQKKKEKKKYQPVDLPDAVRVRDVDACSSFLSAGADANAGGVWTPLSSTACAAAKEPAARAIALLLLQHGADPNVAPDNADPPIFHCARVGDEDMVRALLAHGARRDGVTRQGHTLLHDACNGGLVWLVDELLAAGADANARTHHGNAPLHYAVGLAIEGKDVVTTAQRVLAAGADLHWSSPYRDLGTALHWSCARGVVDGTALLLEAGSDLDARTAEHGMHALHCAALSGPLANVELLLDRGVDVEIADRQGWRALHFAAVYGQTDKVRLLLARGADPNAATTMEKNRHPAGLTPLVLAREAKIKACVDVLRAVAPKKASKKTTKPKKKTKARAR